MAPVVPNLSGSACRAIRKSTCKPSLAFSSRIVTALGAAVLTGINRRK